MIALGVKLRGELENMSRAILHAETASLTALLDDMQLTTRDFQFVDV
jgi:hypothetical protein